MACAPLAMANTHDEAKLVPPSDTCAFDASALSYIRDVLFCRVLTDRTASTTPG